MEGSLKKVYRDLQYGFIQAGRDSYFLHKTDFDGHWGMLCSSFDNGETVHIEFEPTTTDKGLRAKNARLSDV